MNKEDIITLPNPLLRDKSQKISIVSKDILELIENMKKATLSWEDSRKHEVGVALAAVQVGHTERLVIIRNNFDDKNDRTFQILINPEVVKKYGEIVEDYEGCLSIKNIYGKVPRYSKVKVKAKNIDNKEIRITAEGFLARVLQHEIDHTKGIVFIDHIKDMFDSFYVLKDDGSLEKLDYDKEIKNNSTLWDQNE